MNGNGNGNNGNNGNGNNGNGNGNNGNGNIAASVAVGLGAAVAAGTAYYLWTNRDANRQSPWQAQDRPSDPHRHRTWSDLLPLQLFWKRVEEQQNEEETLIRECLETNVAHPEAKNYRHRHNKFDEGFEKLLGDVLKIKPETKKTYVEALMELQEHLFDAMKSADPLFEFLYRDYRPAGSSWEDLKIGLPDEFDINVILFPVNVQTDLQVVYLNKGQVGLRLPTGFHPVHPGTVQKKLKSGSHQTADSQSLAKKLNKWLDSNNYIERTKVFSWMQSVVARALNILQEKEWVRLKKVVYSTSGPAVTLNVDMRDGQTFSVDLVPSLELSITFLPENIRTKAESVNPQRTWYAIPKGPNSSPEKEWRGSLYELERDLMNGNQHMKPCIRIMKCLRDEQNWKVLSSYYIKTMFMRMWQDDFKNWGLGRTMMQALETLEESLRQHNIKYYWDDSLNLLENRFNTALFLNIANQIFRIRQKFERSLDDDSVDPMVYFRRSKPVTLPHPGTLGAGPAQVTTADDVISGIKSLLSTSASRPAQNSPADDCSIM